MNKLSSIFDTRTKLASIAVLSLIAFSVYGLYCFNTVSQVKINGPHYRSIAMGNELVADVLPPGEYLVETYLTAYEMMDADEGELTDLIRRADRLKSQFLERSAHWNLVLAEDSIKHALMGMAVVSGNEMLGTLENGYIPALQAGDRVRAQALLHGTMQRQFREHREGVDAVVRMARIRNLQNENDVARMVHERTLGQVVMGLLLVITLAAACFHLVRKCEKELKHKVYGMLTGEEPLSRDIREKMMWN